MTNEHPPADFLVALESLRGHSFRPECHVQQIPPPTRIAPWAVALSVEVNPDPDCDPDSYMGDGRFVVLYDPAGQPAWEGTMRIITNVRAPIEREMGDDPMLGEVAWSWLTSELDRRHLNYRALNGTVTRVYDESFGGLHLLNSRINVEIRASWTPSSPEITADLRAWIDLAATAAGLAPEGVTSLQSWRS